MKRDQPNFDGRRRRSSFTMFSALKKLTSKSPDGQGALSPGPNGGSGTAGAANSKFNPMDANLQRKFAGRTSVHYNMKLVIKGDRNTGKSSLFNRLQGKPFSDESYVPTDEIQVGHIHWTYKAADDVVKVEVWDVVDKGKKRKPAFPQNQGLKIRNQEILEKSMEELTLDAELVDVYKGTHAVVFLMDVTKLWTFDYVKKELPKVPKSIPILVMANFIDLSHHRQVTRDQVLGFIGEMLDDDFVEIRFCESSMRNGFGLKLLHRFLNVPYLHLQRQSLQTQLEINSQEMEATKLEMELFLESDEANYDVFLEGVTRKRRSKAEDLAPKPTASVVVGQPSNQISTKSVETARDEKEVSVKKGLEAIADQQSKIEAIAKSKELSPIAAKTSPSKSTRSYEDVDSFMPNDNNGGGIDNFLESGEEKNDSLKVEAVLDDSDSDGDVNPMVMKVNQDFEEDSEPIKNTVRATRSYSMSSSSDDEAPKKPPVVTPKTESSKPTISVFTVSDDEVDNDEDAEEVVEQVKKKHKKHKKEKKRKKKSEERQRNDLEEFLNGTPASREEVHESGNYEEL